MESQKVQSKSMSILLLQMGHILQDEDMTDYTRCSRQIQSKDSVQSQYEIYKQQQLCVQIQKEEQDVPIQRITYDNKKVSRLLQQKEKYQLKFVELVGEVFILLVQSALLGNKKKQIGHLMMTNYRLMFFKKYRKKVDTPFGIIQSIQSQKKKKQIIINLKNSILFKFEIFKNQDYSKLIQYPQLYLKPDQIRLNFAFNNYNQFTSLKWNIQKQYNRIIKHNNNDFICIKNQSYSYCSTYPPQFYIPVKIDTSILQCIIKHRQHQRIPVLTYIYRKDKKNSCRLWRSSAYIHDNKSIKISKQSQYLNALKNSKQSLLIIYDTGSKSTKLFDEHNIDSSKSVQYMQHSNLSAIRNSYLGMVEIFLSAKKDFIKNMLATKWYQQICKLLRSAVQIKNKLIELNDILIHEQDGWDRVPQIISLVMIIIDPYYRTFEGFSTLIMKQFIAFGHPFANRLGNRKAINEQYPIFIQFLDCISQLINQNPLSFQFNHKYISKLSNLMYMNIFGTFICNNYQEYEKNRIQLQTTAIWSQIKTNLTTNFFYNKIQSKIIEVSSEISDIRLWKEHFLHIAVPMKDSYQLYPQAEENTDYIQIQFMKIKHNNCNLHKQISKQQQILEQMKEKIKRQNYIE